MGQDMKKLSAWRHNLKEASTFINVFFPPMEICVCPHNR